MALFKVQKENIDKVKNVKNSSSLLGNYPKSTVTLSNDVPIKTVSKLLGNSKLSTTQVYARVKKEKVSVDMKTLSNKLNNHINTNMPLLIFLNKSLIC